LFFFCRFARRCGREWTVRRRRWEGLGFMRVSFF
jgi:hypothetical protein